MRRLRAAVAIALGSSALVAVLHQAGALERLELIALDARYATGIARKAPDDDIVIAWIDQESIDYLDKSGVPFPWPRSVYAQTMEYMRGGGAKAVVFDLLFDQRGDSAEDDRTFGEALAAAHGDVLATKFVDTRDGARDAAETERFARRALAGEAPRRAPDRGVVLPIPELEAGADRLGFVNISPDADKTYRHYDTLRAWRAPGADAPRAYASLAFAAALAADAAPAAIPAGDDARMLLNFRGPEFTFAHVKLVNILESITRIDNGEAPLYPPERFRDKIVLVGLNAEGLEDVHPTPLSARFPGVELHATALDNLLRGDALRPVRGDLLFVGAAAAAATACVFLVPNVALAVGALALLAVLGAAAALICFAQLLVLPVAAPATAGLTAAGASFVWRLVVEGKKRRELRRAFASYLAPEVLAEVLRDPDQLALGGATRDVTLLFTDLQGFTTLAERVEPEQLVGFLNDYFTRMCAPILKEHGVIDKFIGDAIMALFGAPLEAPDHPARAVRAALAAIAVSTRISEELVASGHAPIETRIGIHSGPAVVGNMGSRSRFDYTAIGDTVNLAARLEGANKGFGTKCLVSEAAWSRLDGSVVGREVGCVAVKGRDAPIAVFEPLALAADADAELRARAARHAAALERLRAGDRAAAAAAFKALAAAEPDDLVAARYVEHLGDATWDGVFRIETLHRYSPAP